MFDNFPCLIDDEDNPCLYADGFDHCILGVSEGGVLVYDRDKMIETLIEQGLSYEDAVEHFNFNIAGAYVGDKTPMYITNIQSDIQELVNDNR